MHATTCTKSQKPAMQKPSSHMQEHTHAHTRGTIHVMSNNKQKNKSVPLSLALLLTEDNHSQTASPCCLALGVSACLRLSKCTRRATVDHWQHHPRPVPRPAVTGECPHTQSDCLTKVSG